MDFECATVEELIIALQKLPEEKKRWKVSMQGCDCFGDLAGGDDDEHGYITLRRY